MKEIQLSQGKVALVDDEDFERLSQWGWHYHIGYAARMSPRPRVKGKSTIIYMHRLIMNTPDGMQVDHINGEGLDNRRENLRNCTNTENQHNQKLSKKSTTGFKGVRKRERRFEAQIRVDGKDLYLGMYATPEEAARAYDNAAVKYFGEFSKVNFD